MQIKRTILIVILFLSLIANGIMTFLIIDKISIAKKREQEIQSVSKILHFRNLFTQKILLSDTEVDFNSRLDLENAVRNINDPEILSEWEIFVQSKTKESATSSAEKLVEVLIKKSSF